MPKNKNNKPHVLEKVSFSLLISLIVSIGIFLFTIATTLVVTNYVNDAFEDKILTDIKNVTNNYAEKATLAVLYESTENAVQISQTLIDDPLIIGARIIDINEGVLFEYSNKTSNIEILYKSYKDEKVFEQLHDNEKYWHIVSPIVISESQNDEYLLPFTDEAEVKNTIGYVEVYKSKDRLKEITSDIFINNISISLTLAAILVALIIYLTSRLTRPMKQLVGVMDKVQHGEYFVRSNVKGPKEINEIEFAFNTMVDYLEGRDSQIKLVRDQALQAAKAKGEFAANVTHELRTPMNAVLGMLELLKETDLSSKQNEFIDVAKKSADALLKLIDEILDFAKIEAGKLDFETNKFKLANFIKDISDLLTVQAAKKNLTLNVNLSKDIPYEIVAVESKIRQVLINLIGNAIKFTEKGSINLTITRVNSESVTKINFKVEDTGIGIPVDKHKTVFEAFSQVDGTSSRKYSGSGLGLAICSKLIKQMNGEIGLESEIGKGSTFWFELPIKVANEKKSHQEGIEDKSKDVAQETLINTKKMKIKKQNNNINILIVEDNKTNQYVALGMFSKLGFSPVIASNGKEAYEEIMQNEYDIVFMDVQMPIMDGFETTKKIRLFEAEQSISPLLIISMTANVSDDDKNKCLECGMNDFLGKPLTLHGIKDIFDKYFEISPKELSSKTNKTPRLATTNVLDFKVFNELKESVGDAIEIMVEAFIEDIPENIKKIKEGIIAKDNKAVVIAAHSLKGSSRTFGAKSFSSICLEIEDAANNNRLSEINDRVPMLEESSKELLSELKNISNAGKEIVEESSINSLTEIQHKSTENTHDNNYSKTEDNRRNLQSGPKILIIEDQLDTRIAIAAALKKDNYRIVEANSGNQGIDICKQQNIDLILLDCIMPDKDGFETCQGIRDLNGYKKTPILMVTALDASESIEKAFDVGANDFIAKPINFSVLKKRISRLIQASHSEKHIEKLAFHDQLTGLPNRTTFISKIEKLVEDPKRGGRLFAILVVALDRFKYVNDTFGHQIGDLLLNASAERLTGAVRTSDYIARLGSDEFAIILDGIASSENAASIAEKLCILFNNPFILNGQKVHITCSIGVSLYPVDTKSPDDLIKFADTAMFRAKEKRDTFRFYELGMETLIVKRVKMEAELRQAIENDELTLYFQPQKDLRTNKIYGAETLVRWQHPEKGLIPPNEFIPLAEESGLIIELGNWVLRRACEQYVKWRTKGYPALYLSVNLSGRQIENPGLVDAIEKIIYETDMFCEHLELEITESAMLSKPDYVISVLDKIRDLNIRLAIDDFGTGHSSLSYLRRFPVNTLKIDRSFVMEITECEEDANILSGIISLAKSLSLVTVAEGVETFDQEKILNDKNCDIIQGYYLDKPMSADDFEERIFKALIFEINDIAYTSPNKQSEKRSENSSYIQH